MAQPRALQEDRRLHIVFVSRVRLNPYVRLLARGVSAALPQAHIEHSHFLSLPWMVRHLASADILHIHWIEHLYLAPSAWQRRKGFLSVMMALLLARLAGKRIVYTVHNLDQHEGRSPLLNRLANHAIFHLAHAVHVHDTSVAEVVARRYHRRKNVFVIPHGSYIGAYPDTTDRQNARRHLEAKGIPVGQDTFLFLFLGQVRPYKGVESLIAAFRQVDAPGVRLLIAGKAEEPAYAAHIRTLAQEDARIVTHLTYVADDELQYFFRAADVCVFPYRRITTSGAALLAFSFGCPIIAPALGPFRDLATDGRGLLYRPNDVKGLARVLEQALRGALMRGGEQARRFAESLNWTTLGHAHVRVYERLLCRPLLPQASREENTLPPLVCAGRDPWQGPWRNRHHLMSRLGQRTPVLYLEPRPYVRRVLRDPLVLPWRGRTVEPLPVAPDLHVLMLPAWTARSRRSFGRLSDRMCARVIGRALRRAIRCAPALFQYREAGSVLPILWLTSPDQGDMLHLVPHSLAVYHVVDDYTAYEADYLDASRLEPVRTQHRQLLQQADVVICTHPALVEQARTWNAHVHLVRNGVDWELYRRSFAFPFPPPDLETIPHPRVGYVGVVNDKIDLSLLRELVETLADIHLVLVGPERLRHTRGESDLLVHPRIHRLGFKEPQLLPLYLHGLDVALMPYRLNRWSAHIDPLKLYEYMAIGLPTVSTAIPAVERVQPLLYVASTHEVFVQHVRDALSEADPSLVAARRTFARENRWEVRVQEIAAILQARLASLPAGGASHPQSRASQ